MRWAGSRWAAPVQGEPCAVAGRSSDWRTSGRFRPFPVADHPSAATGRPGLRFSTMTFFAAGTADWTDRGAFWVAAAALAVAAASLWYARSSANAASRSATHAETSADAAVKSAGSAEVAARAAEKSADADGQVARLELDRDHEAYRPPQPIEPRFELAANGQGGDDLWFTFTVPRSYRLSGATISRVDNTVSKGPLSMSLAQAAGQEVRVYVDHIPTGKAQTDVRYLNVRFWPPADVDEGVERWTCRCGRPLDVVEATQPGEGHWEWLIEVKTPPRRRTGTASF